jgi:tetratricopeptide (TPR) repeat protein
MDWRERFDLLSRHILGALLRGGKARFRDVEQRLKRALQAKNISDPGRWCADTKGNLNSALAEVVTLAADDVLLDALLARLDPLPLARELLLGTSLYRVLVNEVALAWQVGEETTVSADPEREQRLQAFAQAVEQVKSQGEEPTWENLGLSPQVIQQVMLDLQQARRPPLNLPERVDTAREALEDLGLLAPVQLSEESGCQYTVHRWTAGALARRSSAEALRRAHQRAARYWRWRVDTGPQTRQQGIEELLEARYHYHQAGEIDKAVEITMEVCSQLDIWGAWDREKHLCQEVLTWVPERSSQAAGFLHRLGNVSYLRGAYEEALQWYRQSLAILEELGDRAGMARAYSQIGVLLTERGAPEEGLLLILASLAIDLELDSPDIRIDFHWLTRERELFGEERFLSILNDQLHTDAVQTVLRLLQEFAAQK